MVRFKHNNFSELISQALKLERIELEAAPEKNKPEKTEKEKERKSIDQSFSGPPGYRKKLWGTQ